MILSGFATSRGFLNPGDRKSMRAAEAVHADGQEYGRDCAGAAVSSQAVIGSMRRHDIRFTAGNYAVWQSFLSGANPTLKRTIEIVLSNGGTIEQAALNRLYARHFCPRRGAIGLQQAAQRSQEQVARAIALLAGEPAQADVLAELNEVCAQINEVVAASATLIDRLSRSEERVALLESYLNDATRDAATDSLTGLLNRRAFDAGLRTLAADAMNSGAELSFILIDVDHFKLVNDTWGHPIGDEVLRHVAAMLTRKVRGGDLLARYGGEEFAVVLRQTGRQGALKVAENLRETVSSHPFIVTAGFDDTQTEARLCITISAGLSSYVPGEPIARWLGRADEALYRAKRAGRNRIVFGGNDVLARPDGAIGPNGTRDGIELPAQPNMKASGKPSDMPSEQTGGKGAARKGPSLPPPPVPPTKSYAAE
jgi:diguanylate cyclase